MGGVHCGMFGLGWVFPCWKRGYPPSSCSNLGSSLLACSGSFSKVGGGAFVGIEPVLVKAADFCRNSASAAMLACHTRLRPFCDRYMSQPITTEKKKHDKNVKLNVFQSSQLRAKKKSYRIML